MVRACMQPQTSQHWRSQRRQSLAPPYPRVLSERHVHPPWVTTGHAVPDDGEHAAARSHPLDTGVWYVPGSTKYSMFDPVPYWSPVPYYHERQTQGARGWDVLNAVPQAARVGIYTRGFVSNWLKAGALRSLVPLDPSVYALYERCIDAVRGEYEYYVEDENGVRIELYRRDTPGRLRQGDLIKVPSKEAIGMFQVLRFADPDVQYADIRTVR